MKIKISVLTFLFSFALFLATSVQLNAQPVVKQKAKKVINRTAVVIHAAHKETMVHHVYTGKLKHAVAHQRFAIRLYHEGRFMRSMHHSRRARQLAHMHIEANKGTPPPGFELQNDERPDGMIPPNTDIDKALENNPDIDRGPTEEEMINGQLENIDIK